ncbi:uncharacterized protein [Dermacentor albipictus]|uniref:uncharacterized protein n=1 Tax=Dermacentor albipictus TaxID=60249 RepID=UPI0038FC7E02
MRAHHHEDVEDGQPLPASSAGWRIIFSLAWKSRALEATNPKVDGPSTGEGAAALAADARVAGGKAATTLVVGWAGAGVCCGVALLRAPPAYPEVREYSACPPSQLGQWSVPLQLLDSCSCSPHFAQSIDA